MKVGDIVKINAAEWRRQDNCPDWLPFYWRLTDDSTFLRLGFEGVNIEGSILNFTRSEIRPISQRQLLIAKLQGLIP